MQSVSSCFDAGRFRGVVGIFSSARRSTAWLTFFREFDHFLVSFVPKLYVNNLRGQTNDSPYARLFSKSLNRSMRFRIAFRLF